MLYVMLTVIVNPSSDKTTGEFGTHKVLTQGLHALDCMEHRGACGGDDVSGDGAGIMTQIPWKMFSEYTSDSCPKPGVGMIFLPRDEERRNAVKEVIESVCKSNELDFIGWREVPVDNDALGPMARDVVPSMWQFFVKAPERSVQISGLYGWRDPGDD